MIDTEWPVADFDAVRRLRVIAACTRGASVHETVIAAPFDRVWAVAADLEGELPRWLFPDIRSITVAHADGGGRLLARAVGHSGLRARFDVVLRPGWCLMQSRFLLGGMAATAEDGGTRFAFLGAFRGPLRLLAPVSRPLSSRVGAQALARFTERVRERGR
jgi:Polyketide cyclase / dehydrase and lipid transport